MPCAVSRLHAFGDAVGAPAGGHVDRMTPAAFAEQHRAAVGEDLGKQVTLSSRWLGQGLGRSAAGIDHPERRQVSGREHDPIVRAPARPRWISGHRRDVDCRATAGRDALQAPFGEEPDPCAVG
jgi:hypothetical protein